MTKRVVTNDKENIPATPIGNQKASAPVPLRPKVLFPNTPAPEDLCKPIPAPRLAKARSKPVPAARVAKPATPAVPSLKDHGYAETSLMTPTPNCTTQRIIGDQVKISAPQTMVSPELMYLQNIITKQDKATATMFNRKHGFTSVLINKTYDNMAQFEWEQVVQEMHSR